MEHPGGTNDDEGAQAPTFDETWIKAAKRSESEIRRYQVPPPRHVPAPWRTWTPPEQADPANTRPSPPRPRSRRPGWAGVLLGLLGLIALVALAVRVLPASDGTDDRGSPAAGGPVVPSTAGTTTAVPTAPLTTLATLATHPATRAARPLPWTPATVMPPAGPDGTHADVFATIKVGACLATTPDLRSITLVPCSGPHTDEVTLVRDLTAMFVTTPTIDQIQALNNQLCPPAAEAWTGGTEQRYTPGYLWQFENGVPGQVVRAFACTVMLSGHSPFSGTLRRAAA